MQGGNEFVSNEIYKAQNILEELILSYHSQRMKKKKMCMPKLQHLMLSLTVTSANL